MDLRDLKIGARFVTIATVCAIAFGSESTHGTAGAQALQSLHVRNFAMTTDNQTPHVGQSIRLTITAHVDEQISQLDNVLLPNLVGFDVQGDDRSCVASSKGTDYTETLVMVPNAPGSVTIGSATMVAVDATDHQPNRFATNSIHFDISPAVASLNVPTGFFAELFWNMVKAFLLLGAFAVAGYFLLRYLGRPRAPKLVEQPAFEAAPPLQQASVEDFWLQYRKLVDSLIAEPIRPRAIAVRHALRYALDAHEKETLADLVRRNAAGDHPQTIAALRAVERACFCEDAYVTQYVEESLPFLKI